MGKVFIVIPVYNEETVIADVIKDIKKTGYKNLIVVDDGSTDKSGAKAKKNGAIVLRHILNRGKGAAVKTGIEAAKILGAEVVITLDGDGQHDPKDINKIISALNKKSDVVLGTRFFNDIPFLRRIGNLLANLSTFVIYGMWVRDSQSGFRGFSRKALSLIDTQHDRYEYDSEIVREIGKNKLKFAEVPIKVIYSRYSQQKTSRQGFYNGIKTLFRMAISS